MRFLFVDRIVQLIPGEVVRGIKHVTCDDRFLFSDDKGRDCFASSLVGEALGQLAAWNVMASNDFRFRPVAGVVASVALHRNVFRGETILLESFIDCLDEAAVEYHSVARVGSETVCTIDGALGPLLPMEQFISQEDVRRQFTEINRPGTWTDLDFSMTGTDIATPDWNPSHVPLSFDRIVQSEPGQSLIAEKKISRSAAWFPDHFPYNPVLPLTILLECKMNLAREFLRQAGFDKVYQPVELRKIKMKDFVYPGEVLCCHLQVLKQDEQELILRYRTEVNQRRVCVMDLVMKAKDDE